MGAREEMGMLAEDILRSYGQRADDVADIREATRGQLQKFGKTRREAAADQRKDLSQRRNELAQDVKAQMEEFAAAQQAMAARQRKQLSQARARFAYNVGAQIDGLDTARRAMATRQREELSQWRARLAGGVAAKMADIAREHAGARREWQDLVTSMLSRRAGSVAVEDRPAPVSDEEPAAIEDQEQEKEEVVPSTEVPAAKDGFATLRNRVFEYLANHPDGTRLVEIESAFGLSRFQANRVVKQLVQEGKANKRDLLYFAI